MFEREYLARIRVLNPGLVRALEKSGELKAHLEEVCGKRAANLYEQVLIALEAEYPPNQSNDLDRLGHLRTLQVMAREKVLELL